MLLRFRPGGFGRNMALLGLATIGGQALVVLASPILARLYSPEAFGAFGVFTVIAMTFATAAALKYETAIVLEEREQGAAATAVLAALLVLVIAALANALFWLAPEAWMGRIRGDSLALLRRFGGLSILSLGMIFVLNEWAVRYKNFKYQACGQLTRSAFTVTGQLLLALITGAGAGLVGGQIAGQSAAALLLLALNGRSLWGAVQRQGLLWQLRAVAVRHRAFAFYSAPQSMLNAVSLNLPTLLLALFFAPAQVGLYWFANRLMDTAKLVLEQATRGVFYRRAVELRANGRGNLPTLRLLTLGLLGLCVPVAVVVMLFGPALFALVFGEAWRGSGEFARWIVMSWTAAVAVIPSSAIVPVLGLQRAYLIAEIGGISLQAAAFVLGARLAGEVGAVAGFCVTAAAVKLAWIAVCFTVTVRQDRERCEPPPREDCAPQAPAV